MKLISPIPQAYMDERKFCHMNQMFGQNLAPFYAQLGLLGHNGIDFRTKFRWKYIYHNVLGFRKEVTLRGSWNGNIPVLAAHDGYLNVPKNEDKTRGIYMKLWSDEVVYGRECRVETVYFHLDSVRVWMNDKIMTAHELQNGENFVKAGTILGEAGNTGKYTTGAHLHFGLRIFWKMPDGSYQADWDNGYDGYVDPLPLFTDDIVYVRGSNYFHKGKQITKQEANLLPTPL